jgi:hypothetical protein
MDGNPPCRFGIAVKVQIGGPANGALTVAGAGCVEEWAFGVPKPFSGPGVLDSWRKAAPSVPEGPRCFLQAATSCSYAAAVQAFAGGPMECVHEVAELGFRFKSGLPGLSGPSGGPGRCLIHMKTKHIKAPAPAAPRRGRRWGLHVLCFHMYEAPRFRTEALLSDLTHTHTHTHSPPTGVKTHCHGVHILWCLCVSVNCQHVRTAASPCCPSSHVLHLFHPLCVSAPMRPC